MGYLALFVLVLVLAINWELRIKKNAKSGVLVIISTLSLPSIVILCIWVIIERFF